MAAERRWSRELTSKGVGPTGREGDSERPIPWLLLEDGGAHPAGLANLDGEDGLQFDSVSTGNKTTMGTARTPASVTCVLSWSTAVPPRYADVPTVSKTRDCWANDAALSSVLPLHSQSRQYAHTLPALPQHRSPRHEELECCSQVVRAGRDGVGAKRLR